MYFSKGNESHQQWKYHKFDKECKNSETLGYKIHSTRHRKLLKRVTQSTGVLLATCLLVTSGVLSYKLIFKYFEGDLVYQNSPQCNLAENNRFDCWPEKIGATEEKCNQRGCCWKVPSQPETAPDCFFSSDYFVYNVTSFKETSSGMEATLRNVKTTFFSKDVKNVKLQIEYQTDTRLHIKFTDQDTARYEVPFTVPSGPSDTKSRQYSVQVNTDPFNIVVKRVSTGAVVFDTTETAPLIFSDQFLQIATRLSSKYLFGLGEHRSTFLHELSTWKRLVFWNRDSVPQVGTNGYGSHPFYVNLEPKSSHLDKGVNIATHDSADVASGKTANAHGVFLLNSNAGEIALQPFQSAGTGSVTYRFLGGVLDFYILLGPNPLSVVSQYTEIVGRPYFPPFWSLGYHLCKWGYNSSIELETVIQRNRDALMPYVALQPFGDQDTGAITYRMMGGVLDLFIVMGPDPVSVVSQYTDIVGRPYLPPFWSLGFHLCRYGYASATELQQVIDRNRAAQMPYDVQWNDIDYMAGHRDWTHNLSAYSALPNVVKDLHENNQRYVIIVDPAISSNQPSGTYPPFDEGKDMNVFVKNSTGGILTGEVWPGQTAFPDFFHPNASQYWTKQAEGFHYIINFDGLWIDMNEPSNFVDGSAQGCPASLLNRPPYVPPTISGGSLYAKTICPSAQQSLSSHYNLHNMYGWSMANVSRSTLNSLFPKKRSLLITRSSFPGSGQFTGHWLGDNRSGYDEMYYSIPGILNFNLFGIPQIGADICGFRETTTPELCVRWHQLGAFYPFMRNHNSIGMPDQDPAVFSSPYKDYIRSALQLRYKLLAVLYNYFFDAHVSGLPIVRPLFFMFPGTEPIDVQFMWGDQLLISPVLEKGARTVKAFIPNDTWYDFYTGAALTNVGKDVTLDAPLERINVHVRGGSILPLLPPTQRTDFSRQQKFDLLVAPNVTRGARGQLFWDDGEDSDSISANRYSLISFTLCKNELVSAVLEDGYTPVSGITLGSVKVLGILSAPTKVDVNGKTVPFNYDSDTKALNVSSLSVDLLQPMKLSWE